MSRKLYGLLLTVYSRDKRNGLPIGSPPLDIPTRSIVFTFVVALIVSIVIGNLFLRYLYELSVDGSKFFPIKGVKQVIHRNSPQIKEDEILEFISRKFLARQKLQVLDSTAKKELLKYFAAAVGFDPLTSFAKLDTASRVKNEFAQRIAGKLDFASWLIFPITFDQETETAILDSYGIKEQYSENADPALEIRRNIILSGMAQIREELSANWLKPRRLLQALGGGIQWITFILSVWGLILIWIRKHWSRLQIKLTQTGKLPYGWATVPSLWDTGGYQPDAKATYTLIEKAHSGMFVPARLIKEVHIAKGDDKETKVRAFVRDRIAAYRNSVDEGEYEIINFIIWAVPSLGFLGTIIGIIGAMENVAIIVRSRGVNETAAAIKQVSVYLGTAFDTTFVALVLIVFLSFLLASARRLEASFFELLEYQANRHLPYLWNENKEA